MGSIATQRDGECNWDLHRVLHKERSDESGQTTALSRAANSVVYVSRADRGETRKRKGRSVRHSPQRLLSDLSFRLVRRSGLSLFYLQMETVRSNRDTKKVCPAMSIPAPGTWCMGDFEGFLELVKRAMIITLPVALIGLYEVSCIFSP
jgi:hypothetical protein